MSDDVQDTYPEWVVETNDASGDQPAQWTSVWETWFMDDAEAAKKMEAEYIERRERYLMAPRPFIEVLEMLKIRRPNRTAWGEYRFRNVRDETIVNAWVLK